MASLVFEGVGKVYPDGTRALRDFSLEIGDGEFMVLVGPSGCGKTTALRMVAGLEEITEGEIQIGGQVVNDLEPRERDIAMVFQNYALYPHMSVFDNIAFGLQTRRVPKDETRRKVDEIAGVLGLRELLKRKPRALSGGQRQRVAMGRAIVRDPQVFLMDEPLSNLDAKLRVQMRSEIGRIQRELGATTMYVTHDQVEAMTMGDRVCVLRLGTLQQEGEPQELYDSPRNLFVASFIGSPSMNLVRARLERAGDGFELVLGEQRLAVPASLAGRKPGLAAYAGREVALGIRPEALEDAALESGARDGGRLTGQVRVTEALGAERLVHVEVDVEPVMTDEVLEVAGDLDVAVLDELRAEAARHRAVLVGRFGPYSRVAAGDTVEMTVDTRALHVFDLETGLAVDP